jgi:hypothetical protein
MTHGRWMPKNRVTRAERDDSIRRTVYVSEIDHTVSNL